MDTIMIDNGSHTTKAGFSTINDQEPGFVFPSLVGVPRRIKTGVNDTIYYVGYWATGKRGESLHYQYPIRQGIITDWKEMERIWHHTFYNELKAVTGEHRVLLSESPLNSGTNREMMTQVMFETFGVLAMAGVVQSVLALCASGRGTGLVLDSGDGISHTVPVYEGKALMGGISAMDIGGNELTDFLLKDMSMERGYTFNTISERENVREIKENSCYVALDFESEMKKIAETSDSTYELPDGTILNIGSERFKCTELLFQPKIFGMECCSFQEMVLNSIRKCDLDIRMELFSNIVLAGGSTLFKGTSERLIKELKEMVPSSVNIEVVAPPRRIYSVWIGGSIMSSLSTFDSWITRKEYEEVGSSIVHRK